MKKILGVLLVMITSKITAQERVSFTVNNPNMKTVMMDFKSTVPQSKKIAGYGYSLNGLASHAVNMVAPVYVYVQRNEKLELLVVVRKEDEGKSFSINKKYEISREDWLFASDRENYLENAWKEYNAKQEAKEKLVKEKSIEEIAKEKGLKMIRISVVGKSLIDKQVYVRYQLPWESNNVPRGFSTGMSRFKSKTITLPVGTKIYECSGKYWEKNSKHTERLIVELDEEKQNYSFKI